MRANIRGYSLVREDDIDEVERHDGEFDPSPVSSGKESRNVLALLPLQHGVHSL